MAATEAPGTPAPPLPLWRAVLKDFVDDDIPSLAAAIAFYTTFSLSPLVLLSVAVLGALYPSAQERFIAQVATLAGENGATVIRAIVDSASSRPTLRHAAGWIGAVVLLFGASAVFAQLQVSLNRIWEMENRTLTGLRGFLRRRLLSAGVLLSLLFLTIVSFVMQATLALLPGFEEQMLGVVWWLISFGMYVTLFAALYHWLPDRHIPWHTALRGGALTAALFLVGRLLIGLYLRNSSTAGAFGPAGALMLWLLWSYYSAMVFLLAAELLYELARRRRWNWWQEFPPRSD